MAEQDKVIVHIEILHEDEPGYGPEGKHTRREWRAECFENLLAGKAQFEAWQKSWHKKAKTAPEQNYAVVVHFEGEAAVKISNFKEKFSLDFSGLWFEDDIDCSEYLFLIRANFIATQFKGNAKFDRAHFNETMCEWVVDFYRASFSRFATFREAKFDFGANFVGVQFKDHADFIGAKFLLVKFDASEFRDTAFFWGADFSYSKFLARSELDEFDIGWPWFDEAISASFVGVRFRENANFEEARFGCNTFFLHSEFYGDTKFDRAIFARRAIFDIAQFSKIAWFKGTQFINNASFAHTNFKNLSLFYDSQFNKVAFFENAVFDNVGHFEDAVFLGANPAFRGCKIDSTRLEFSDESHFTQNDYSEDAIKNISFLKRLADEHGQTDQALNFNAMELRAKRLNALNTELLYEAPDRRLFLSKWWETCFTLLYEKVSDFGRSFTKPFFYLICLLCLTFVVVLWSAYLHRPVNFNQSIFTELNAEYLLTKNDGSQTTPLTAFRAAGEYSLYRSGNFLDFTDADKNTASINMRLFGSEIEPWWARVFGFFKGIATAVLLFLIALGLRNKYRVS